MFTSQKKQIHRIAASSVLSMCFFATFILSPPSAVGREYRDQPSPTSPSSPTPSQSSTPSTFCASTRTGQVRNFNHENCPNHWLNLGNAAISRSTNRPKSINPYLANRIRAAQIAANQKQFNIGITSAWRSLTEQTRIYNKAITKYKSAKEANNWVLPPQQSMHPWGLAVDVHFGSQRAANWFKKNSSVFGLCRMYKNEWWHFEPVIAPGGRCPKLKNHAG